MLLASAKDLTLARWDQAWAHYRHLETIRAQYLGFFFTAVLGVIAIAGPRIVGAFPHSERALLLAAALVVALQFFSGFLFLMVARLNEVIEFYGHQILKMNDWISGKEALDLSAFNRPPRLPWPWADHGLLAERVLQVGVIIFLLLSAVVLVRSIDHAGSAAAIYACAAAFVLSAAVAFVVALRASYDSSVPS
jgi:hypothetical protein